MRHLWVRNLAAGAAQGDRHRAGEILGTTDRLLHGTPWRLREFEAGGGLRAPELGWS